MSAADSRVRAHAAATSEIRAIRRASSPRRTALAASPNRTVTPVAASRSLYAVPPAWAAAGMAPARKATGVGSRLPGRVRRRALHQAASTKTPLSSTFTPRAA
ncbi:hypothetical protein GCM10017772_32540 [Promicromonospora soli]|uniref:Uncharacterized protein n=1 Tax=Promicromonospora soli TaxID=2035533 RepID=A0A919G1C5_9MICO|nr:hypothetical protein GCM10017772_32540 [Promicromonospora soli]